MHWSTNIVNFFIDDVLIGACVRVSSYFANDVSWWTLYFIPLKRSMRLIRFQILKLNFWIYQIKNLEKMDYYSPIIDSASTNVVSFGSDVHADFISWITHLRKCIYTELQLMRVELVLSVSLLLNNKRNLFQFVILSLRFRINFVSQNHAIKIQSFRGR